MEGRWLSEIAHGRREHIHTSKDLGAWLEDWAARKVIVFLTIHAKIILCIKIYLCSFYYIKWGFHLLTREYNLCVPGGFSQAHCHMPLMVHTAWFRAWSLVIYWLHSCTLLPSSCTQLLLHCHSIPILPLLECDLGSVTARGSTPLAIFFFLKIPGEAMNNWSFLKRDW